MKKGIKVVLIVFGVLIGLFVLLGVIGALLPEDEESGNSVRNENQNSKTIIADLSSLSTPMDTGIEKIAKVVEKVISDSLKEAEADMGNGKPELELFKVGTKNKYITYKGTVPFYSGASSFDRAITVIYDGKTVVYSFDDQSDIKITIKPSQDNNDKDSNPPKNAKTVNNQDVKKGLETIILKINGKDSTFYMIEFSNSTMRYLSRELKISGLEQTAYIPKRFYDVTVEYLLLFNNIFKEKRVFTEKEISDIQNVVLYLDTRAQDLITETYDYQIGADSFPDGKNHGLTTSIVLIGLIDAMAKFYWKSSITEKYEIDDLQNGIKKLSTGIPKEESDFFMEVFPGIYREMLIKRFVYN